MSSGIPVDSGSVSTVPGVKDGVPGVSCTGGVNCLVMTGSGAVNATKDLLLAVPGMITGTSTVCSSLIDAGGLIAVPEAFS